MISEPVSGAVLPAFMLPVMSPVKVAAVFTGVGGGVTTGGGLFESLLPQAVIEISQLIH